MWWTTRPPGLMDFQEQFGLATKPGFPIEVLRPALLKHIGIPQHFWAFLHIQDAGDG